MSKNSTVRRWAGLAAAAALAAGGALAAAPAQAATTATCNLTAPSRVVIGKPYTTFTLYASQACSLNGGGSAWELVHPSQGGQDAAIFEGTNRQLFEVYDDSTIGRHTWRPLGAFDASDNELSQNAPHSDIRLATAAWVSSKRTKDVVTLTGTSLVYSTGSQKYVKRANASGAFQFRERGGSTWTTLKTVKTGSAATATLAYRYSKTRDYRFVLYTTPVTWDQASATTTR